MSDDPVNGSLRHRERRGEFLGGPTLGELFGTMPDGIVASADLPATIAPEKLALYLSRPSITGEFAPVAPWQGVELAPVTYRVRPGTDLAELRAEFRRGLDRCLGDAEHVGVLFSGGLDSAAVLAAATEVCAGTGRRLTVLHVAQDADDGEASTNYARRTLAALDLRLEPVIVDGRRPPVPAISPSWDPMAPGGSAMPEIMQVVWARAIDHGVQVLLTGDGADELLGIPRFLGADLIGRGLRDLPRYVMDSYRAAGVAALGLEAIAAAAALAPVRTRVQLYLATNAPDVCDPQPSPALAARWAGHVTTWTRQWLNDLVELHIRARHSWAGADAYDSFFPHSALPAPDPATGLTVRSPFLDAGFVATALGLPLRLRYARHLPSAYARRKGAVFALLPSGSHARLPRRKQLFERAFADYYAEVGALPYCRAIGLVGPGSQLDRLTVNDIHQLNALEEWLGGAVAAGVALPPDEPADSA